MKSFGLFSVLGLLLVFNLGADTPLPVSKPSREGIDPKRLNRMHELVESHINDGKHAGATTMVVRNGKIVDWQTWGLSNVDDKTPLNQDSIFRIYSMTKVVTSVAALQLVEQNKIALNSDITEWLPELNGLRVFKGGSIESPDLEEAHRPITVRMLLNHTAGFTYDFFEGSPVHAMYQKADLWNSKDLEEFIQKVATLPLLAQPGSEFHYGIGLDVMGALIQRASGRSFEDYISRNITTPLKMKDTFFDVPASKRRRIAAIHRHDASGKLVVAEPILGAYAEEGIGIPSGGAGLFSTIGDYARFVQMLLNGGVLEGEKVLSRKTIELALQNSLTDTNSKFHEFSPSDGWGLFSAVKIDLSRSSHIASEGMFYWSGAATTHFFADPKELLIGLVFTQHVPFNEHGLFAGFETSIYQALD